MRTFKNADSRGDPWIAFQNCPAAADRSPEISSLSSNGLAPFMLARRNGRVIQNTFMPSEWRWEYWEARLVRFNCRCGAQVVAVLTESIGSGPPPPPPRTAAGKIRLSCGSLRPLLGCADFLHLRRPPFCRCSVGNPSSTRGRK